MSYSQVKGFMERVISNMSTQYVDISTFHCKPLGILYKRYLKA